MWMLAEAVARAGGLLHGEDRAFTGVGTDSRADCSGQLFIALRGERFDGHAYVEAAQRAGAVAAMVDHLLPLDLPQWVVPDTRSGLGRLAAAWRDRFPGRIVAITGSNGKTTVKEMIASILGRVGAVRATRGNLNNDIGMPLTLLQARDEDFLVLEMGANHHGEIGYMTDIARPDVALITNAGRAHLEGFGSVEGVARAKGEIVRGLSREGVFVVAGDSPFFDLWRDLADGRSLLGFGMDPGSADLCVEPDSVRVDWDENGFRTRFSALHGETSISIQLQLAGLHNVRNALAATAAALALGVDIEAIREGLAALSPVKGRLCPGSCGGLSLIDDTYNANPDSIAAAVQVLAGLDGRRWLVLGDLGELGADSAQLHQDVGRMALAAGIDRLATVGELTAGASERFGSGARHFFERGALIQYLRSELGPRDRVLVKGSRAARMELVVEALCAEVGS